MKILEDALVEICILKAANAHDRQALRNARRLARHLGISFSQLLLRGHVGIQAGIQNYRDEVGAALPAAFVEGNRLSGAILRAAQRVSAAHPTFKIPNLAPPELNWIRPLPRTETKAFADQVEGWTPPYKQEPVSIGTGEPMSRATAAEYRAAVMKIPTLLGLGGVPIDPCTDLATCIDPKSVAIWLPELKERYAKATMISFSASVMRLATDLLGKNDPAVVAMRRAFRPLRKGDKGIAAADVEAARDLGSGAMGPIIWSLPDLIDARAHGSLLSVPDRDSRRSCSLACRLVIRRLLKPRILVGIHLRDSLRTIDASTDLVVTCGDEIVETTLSEEIIAHFKRLTNFREQNGIANMWLFRGHGDGPQGVGGAMADLSRNIQAVLNRRMTPTRLRDAVMVNLTDENPTQVEAVADAARISTMQWIETKLRIALDNPLSNPECGTDGP